jgi:peptidoglycan hydrolase-like protein with peptidoglycan-binding domain
MILSEFGAASYPELSSGSTGPYVAELIARLNAAGASTGSTSAADGSYNADTQQAVTNFQNAYGLAASGVADSATWAKLVSVTPGVQSGSAMASTTAAAKYLPASAAFYERFSLMEWLGIGGSVAAGLVGIVLIVKHKKKARAAPAVAGYRRHRR